MQDIVEKIGRDIAWWAQNSAIPVSEDIQILGHTMGSFSSGPREWCRYQDRMQGWVTGCKPCLYKTSVFENKERRNFHKTCFSCATSNLAHFCESNYALHSNQYWPMHIMGLVEAIAKSVFLHVPDISLFLFPVI